MSHLMHPRKLFSWIVPLLAGLILISCDITGTRSDPPGELFETGIASWYGGDYHGTQTANGEIYDMNTLTAAHRTLPFHSVVRVVNVENGRSVTVRINNRGPFVRGRVIDLSRLAAKEIGILEKGLAEVELYLIREGS